MFGVVIRGYPLICSSFIPSCSHTSHKISFCIPNHKMASHMFFYSICANVWHLHAIFNALQRHELCCTKLVSAFKKTIYISITSSLLCIRREKKRVVEWKSVPSSPTLLYVILLFYL
uniref:Uncharacterized protein n=1 Tax=Ciona intestinalis TaxID=7719 RepID=H2XV43_CIOIN